MEKDYYFSYLVIAITLTFMITMVTTYYLLEIRPHNIEDKEELQRQAEVICASHGFDKLDKIDCRHERVYSNISLKFEKGYYTRERCYISCLYKMRLG